MLIMLGQAEIDPTTQAIVLAILAFLVLLPTVFWIWMLRDCWKNELPGSREKVRWMVLIIIFGLFGAFAYNVGRRKKRMQELGR